jgi:N-acetylglucosamine-6-phosphate deacetylase
VPAGQAIAAATLLPRQVLGDDRGAAELLVGMPLAETLRWSTTQGTLGWRRSQEATPEHGSQAPETRHKG